MDAAQGRRTPWCSSATRGSEDKAQRRQGRLECDRICGGDHLASALKPSFPSGLQSPLDPNAQLARSSEIGTSRVAPAQVLVDVGGWPPGGSGIPIIAGKTHARENNPRSCVRHRPYSTESRGECRTIAAVFHRCAAPIRSFPATQRRQARMMSRWPSATLGACAIRPSALQGSPTFASATACIPAS